MRLLDQINDVAAKAERATKGPWRWGDGWDAADKGGSVYSNDGDNKHIAKYMDMQLFGIRDTPVIPIRIDHYEMIYDGDPIAPADRSFIAAARNLDWPAVAAAVRENERLRKRIEDLESSACVACDTCGELHTSTNPVYCECRKCREK